MSRDRIPEQELTTHRIDDSYMIRDRTHEVKNILVEAAKLLADANRIVAEEVYSEDKNRISSTLSVRAEVYKKASGGIGCAMSPHLIVYVHNRFHILFELANDLFFVKAKFSYKLPVLKALGYTNQMIKDLSFYFYDVHRELVVGGLCGNGLLGSWMKANYRKKLTLGGQSCVLTWLIK